MTSQTVPPQLPVTVTQMLPYIGTTIALMQATYLLVHYAYDQGLTSYIGFHPPASELCLAEEDNTKCGRPDLFAFQVVSGITFVVIGGLAIVVWHVKGEMRSHKTAAARLYGYNESVKWVTVLNLSYQTWDFFISLTIPEHCTPIMMTHHVVAATVSWSAIYNYMLGYYPAFFLGLSEVSSIFLVMLDFSKYFQPMPGSYFDAFISKFAGPLFAVFFVYYRVILWWPVSKQLFDDTREVISKGQADSLRPGKNWILYMWLGLNVPMGLLQLYWLTIIIEKARGVVS